MRPAAARRLMLTLLLLAWLAAACSPAPQPVTPTLAPTSSPTPAGTPTRTPTLTWTPAPTWTNTPPPTATPTLTPTRLPALLGTPLARADLPIIESSLPRLGLLAQWGRGRVEGLAYAPNGSMAAIGTPLGVYLYDITAAAPGVGVSGVPQITLSGPRLLATGAPAYRLAFSPDSARLVIDTASPGSGADLDVPPHILQIWDVSGPEPVRTASLVTGGTALALGFSGAGDIAVLLTEQGGARYQLWSGIDLRLELRLTGGETVMEGALSADLGLAATRGQRGPVRLWRLADGVNLATTRESGEAAGPLAFSPDGSLLAVGYPDDQDDFRNTNQVRVWRVPREGGEISSLAYALTDATRGEGAQQTLISLAWSPDGALIAAGYADQSLHVWRAQPGPVYRRLELATLPRFVAFDPSGGEAPRLAAGGLEIWSLGGEGLEPRRLAADNEYLPGIFDMRFLNDGSALALAEYGRIDLRSTSNGARLLEITGMDGPVNGLAVYPQGGFLAAACADGTVRLYRVSDGRYWNQFGEPTLPILSVDFSSNGFWLAASDEGMQVRIFRFLDGVQMASFTEPFVAYRLRFSPNSNQIAALTTSGAQLRGITGDMHTLRLALQGNVGGVSLSEMEYSPGAEYLALVGNGVVRLVNPQTRTDVYSLFEGSENLPWSVAFSPDNAFLAVGWSDGQIRLYWAQDGAPMAAWQAHPAAVRRLAFSADGRLLASLGNEGAIRLWGITE